VQSRALVTLKTVKTIDAKNQKIVSPYFKANQFAFALA